MILEHLLEMEVNQSEAVNQLMKTVNEVDEDVSSLEAWLFKHNTRLGVMTHSDLAGEQEPGAAEEEPRGAEGDGGGGGRRVA